jgi:hypothetical protein
MWVHYLSEKIGLNYFSLLAQHPGFELLSRESKKTGATHLVFLVQDFT